MRSIGVTPFLLLALSAGASADIIAPVSNTWQMDDSVSWESLATDGSANSFNGLAVMLSGAFTQDPGLVAIDFASPVSGAGFVARQANSADSGTFTISAWGAGNSLLGTESVAAASGNDVFAGLLDDTGADIYSVSLNFVDTSNDTGSGNFTIDTFLLSDAPPTSGGPTLVTSNLGPLPTPEPAAIFLCGSALIAAGLFRRRR